LINTPASLFDGAHVFLSLIIGGMTLGALGQWFAAMLNATGDSRTPFVILLVTLVLNAALAPVLITGAGLFPPLGVAGSALSTLIANAAGAAICFFVWRSHRLSEIAPFRFRVHAQTLRRILALGFPLALQMLIVSSSFLFILSLANRYGPDVTAAFGIGSRVDQFAFLATFAVTAAISAMTAQNFGAGRLERIPEITRWGIILSFGIALLFFGVVMLFPDAITSRFTHESAVIEHTRLYFHIGGFSYLALALLFAYQGVLRGAGDTFGSFVIIACSMIFLRVPLCFFLSHYTPLREGGLWLGIVISSFAGAVAFALYYASGRWKKRGTKPAVPAGSAAAEWEPIVMPPEEPV
ncbi:MAG: MATE family efflux transporter, partial [Endomicrobiales bacterium]